MKILKISLILMILIVSSVSVLAAKPVQKTGFDVYIESFGYELISYEITDRYKQESDSIVIMDIVITNGEYDIILTWIMPHEKYLERREKV